jgi:hypothetical protein
LVDIKAHHFGVKNAILSACAQKNDVFLTLLPLTSEQQISFLIGN